MITQINKEVQVAASQETCFTVFTQQMDAWWPRAYHIGAAPMRYAKLEAKPGGRWFSTHADGSEVNIGKVLIWDPFQRLVLNWQIDGNFTFDPNLTTEVEVQFVAKDASNTTIKFSHKNLERLAGAAKVIESMDQGWGTIVNLFKGIAQDDYKTSILVHVPCGQALAAIADVHGWWAKNFTGNATKAGDTFTVRFGDTFVDFEIVRPTPHEITWQVTDCFLHWQDDKTEWKGTHVIWQVNDTGEATRIDMTHIGLNPKVECFADCRKGWTQHINSSLYHLITTGKGTPE
ncbi:MAG: SRPBCC domain-containing protein [Bacteroidota bacterium]|nr:SRPBCC domain-containing protein [Bacteroidota bacterium]